jgi:hypothetical protein
MHKRGENFTEDNEENEDSTKLLIELKVGRSEAEQNSSLPLFAWCQGAGANRKKTHRE